MFIVMIDAFATQSGIFLIFWFDIERFYRTVYGRSFARFRPTVNFSGERRPRFSA